MRVSIAAGTDTTVDTFNDVLRRQAERLGGKLAYGYLERGETLGPTRTFYQLWERAQCIAVSLRARCQPGERALLLYPQGVDFVDAFFGSLLAGVVAVPAYLPLTRGYDRHTARFYAIAHDAQPSVVLTVAAALKDVQAMVSRDLRTAALPCIATDQSREQRQEPAPAEPWRADPQAIAFLIYTSGSTGDPKGVIVTHRSLMHSVDLITQMYGYDEESSCVSWLPLYHDLGLVVVVLGSLHCGASCYLMDPTDFISKPARWLRAISRFRARNACGPNFAFELCARKLTKDQLAELDLSCWRFALTGAEPVRAETLERFTRTFVPCGFRWEAFYPSYGMAEATATISGGTPGEAPIISFFDELALKHGTAKPAAAGPGARALVSCGVGGAGEEIAIVNPDTYKRCEPAHIGEVWVRGDSVGAGYFGRAEATKETFAATLAGEADKTYLRTGDLGFFHHGQLYLAGRLKDLIIARGVNYYPQDIELVVERAHPALRPGGCVAFALDDGADEHLGVVAEVDPEAAGEDQQQLEPVLQAIRTVLASEQELPLARLALIPARALLKTTSGKVRRSATRDALLAGELPTLAQWQARKNSALREPLTAAADPPAGAVPRELAGSLYMPVWTAKRLAAAPQGRIDELLLVGRPEDVDWLEPQLRSSAHFMATRMTRLCWNGDDGAPTRAISREDHEQAIAALTATPTHVLSIAARASSDAGEPHAMLDSATGLFALTKALLRRAKQMRFVHLVAGAQPGPEHLALSGYYKTLRIEKPGYSGRVVACVTEGPQADDLASVLRHELCASDPETDVRYDGASRLVRRFVPVEAMPSAPRDVLQGAAVRRHGVYLITGGMGALGQIIARHLCANYQATVYLIGRSKLSPGQASALKELSALGGKPYYLDCDVIDRGEVRRAVSSVREAGHRLQGVIHAAGMIADAFILRKDPDTFARVVASKTLGTRNLDLETCDEPLDFFVLFSSVAGVLGNIGQCDYAYGNAFEDYYAHQRAALGGMGLRPGRTLSIDWPYWQHGGMRLTDKEEQFLRRTFGIMPLPTAAGLAAFEYGLRQPHAQLVLMQGDRARIHEVLGVMMPAAVASAPGVASQDGDGEPTAAELHARIARYLADALVAQLQVPTNFASDRPLREYGFDSVMMIDLLQGLENNFGHLPKTLFFDHPTLAELATFFVQGYPEACRAIAGYATVGERAQPATGMPAAMPATPLNAAIAAPRQPIEPDRDGIAIVGLAGRYPEAETLEEFWENLTLGRDCVVEIPADRWDIATMSKPSAPTPGKNHGKWGGFLRKVDHFDPLFFNISPKEAELMDPNERLFLETVVHTIEDAGYTPDKLAPGDGVKDNPVGVYVGLMWGDYQLHGFAGPVDAWTTPHSWYWAVANRVSHYFNFSGPSMTLDTACSSSLTAIHLACAAIRSGEVSVAIAGGVNLSLHVHKYRLLSDLRFLSSTGRCRSFGEGGDGYVPGEGVGAVLLKPLAKAVADGDHIYGIIRGTASNHGGKTSGFTVPSSKRQAALVQQAMQKAGVDPRHISYVEAHGTGTSLGDPIEIAGLTKAFGQSDVRYCAIGSVKSNIGHLEAAAGIAGLTKVLLQMQHRTLVPSIHSSPPNPHIEFDESPFVVQRTLAEWPRPRLAQSAGGAVVELKRLAGISSFGAGGSNAHVIVEEPEEDAQVRDAASAVRRPVLLVLSARKQTSVRAMASQLATRIAAAPHLSLDDAAYTLQVGRVPMEFRLAIVAANAAEAIAGLRAYGNEGIALPGVYVSQLGDLDRAATPPEAAQLPQWLQARDLARIAAVWVQGASVDWQQLHTAGTRRRVSLPGYVFDRQRYWADKPQGTAPAASAALHPLIDANVSTLEEQTFRKTLRPEEFFLRDHRLGGNRVLPAVAYLEMVLQSCRLASANHVVAALREVSWLKPIIVDETEETIDIGLIPDGGGLRFEIYQTEGDQRVVYAKGLVEFAASPAAVPIHRTALIDTQALIGRCRAQGRADVAAAFDRMGLSLGSSFQVIDGLYCNSHEAYARLIAPKPAQSAVAGNWILHPALLDAAVRTTLGVGGLDIDTGLRVPVHLRRLELRQPVVGDCGAWAMPAAGATGGADRRHYDVTLLNTDGDVLVLLEGLAIQAVPRLALARAPLRTPAAAQPGAPVVPASAAAVPNSAAPPSRDAVASAVVRHLTILLSEVTKLPADQIDAKAPLENYGIDSLMILALTEKLQATFGDVSKTLFFEYQDLHSLGDYFVESWPEQAHALALGLAAAMPDAAAPSVDADAVDLAAREDMLLACLRETLGNAASACTAATPLADWPIDPIANCRLVHRLQQEFADVAANAAYRYDRPSDWARALRWRSSRSQAAAHALGARAMAAVPVGRPSPGRFAPSARISPTAEQDIAIIGLSGRYPGADNVEQFWAHLCAGKDCITEIPVARWDHRLYFNPDRRAKGKSYSKWGGFIDDIDHFDAGFFNISAREAELLDPQERLFLQTAWECLEDACYPRPALKGRSVGVFVGVMWGHYELIEVSDEQLQYGRPSASFSSIANRVSYFLNLDGPSIALDTMCSSSLTAIHLACQAIRSGDCEMAIAGGVNLIVHPNKYRLLAQGQFLSSDGRCRAFGTGGDGYVPGEGVGAVLLKPYRQAIADGDQVHGVIRASALNHGGKTNGYTVPNQTAQSNVIGKALRRAGWEPRSIDYIEAHGTGTSLGDPIEIAGLAKAFTVAAAAPEQQGGAIAPSSCRIGSVKTNIGHLESAAGIAGLTKVLLQLRHGCIAPSLHSAAVNPHIDFARTPFRVVQQLEEWRGAGRAVPRRAGISSFGAGGSNAHVLIEEHVPPAGAGSEVLPVIFVLSADREERLKLYVSRVVAFLAERTRAGRPVDLSSLAWSSQIGREVMEERLAVVTASVAELIDALTKYQQGASAANLHRGSLRRHGDKLDAIMDASEQDALVRSLLRGGRLQQLAKAWVSFLDVDWAGHQAELYGGGRFPLRMSFPTLPFLTQRYWVQEKATSATSAAALHPLLDANISTLSHQSYSKEFRGDEFYLRDHIVEAGNKRVILPGAAYLEMVRAAGELCMDPDWSVRFIRNLFWLQPIEIKDGPQDVRVSLRQSSDRVEFDVVRCANAICVEGELGYSRRDEAVPDEWLDLEAVRTGGIQEDHPAIYAGYRKLGFHYGPSFLVTQTRYRMPGAALSHLVLPEALRPDAGRYVLHPSLLDGIFRTCLAVGIDAMQAGAGPSVPFTLGEMELRHPLPQQCWAYATDVCDFGSNGSGLRKYNVVVTDAAGRVLLKLKNFAARTLTPSVDASPGSLQYYRYDWLKSPPEPGTGPLGDATVLVIAQDAELARHLLDRHVFARVVFAQATTSPRDTGNYTVDPTSEQSCRLLLARLADDGARPTHIVLHADAADDPDLVSGLTPSDVGVQSIRALFRALEQLQPGQAVRCAYVYAASGDEHRPAHDAVSALARSFLTINHRYELFTLRYDMQSAAVLAANLATELAVDANVGGHEIAWWEGGRHQRCLCAAAPESSARPVPLRERGAYLISGGVGKLGLVLAMHLAQRYRARLLLSGRSAQPNAAQQAAIDAMAAAGAEVHYFSADVAVAADVEALVAQARQRFDGLNGVIHCAGVASDRLVTELDATEFARLYTTKADGARLLDHATRDEPLDFFVYYSSVSAVLGDPGAGAYAAGNRFLDSHALWRDALCRQARRSGKSLTIGWPLWESGGMELAGANASVFGYSGMTPLTSAQGLAAFEQALCGDRTQVLVATGDTDKIARALRIRTKAALSTAQTIVTSVEPFAPEAVPADLLGRVEHYVKDRLAKIVKTAAKDIRVQQTFEQCGMDSVMLMELHASLAQDIAGLPKTVVFEYASPAQLAQYLARHHEGVLAAHLNAASAAPGSPASGIAPAPASVTATAPGAQAANRLAAAPVAELPRSRKHEAVHLRSATSAELDAVAIVGLAGEFPQADDLAEFWDNMIAARDCLVPISGERWPAASARAAPGQRDERRARSGRAGYLRDTHQFDPELFRMSQADAERMDPQLRVLLRSAWRALADAAYTPDALSAQRVGVYVGAMNDDHTWIMSELYQSSGAYFGPGVVTSEFANRISFLLNFRGPSLTVGTACSSSLTAIHLARKAILGGECDVALAGGVSLCLHSSKYLMLADMKVLSPDGRERTFDEEANGLVPSEGAGVVVLKRLQRALADGDHIYGVMRASCISHSGTGAGMFIPNLSVMEETAARAIRESGVPIEELTYIESHGASTKLGDPIELRALANAVQQFTTARQFCAIGTKANLGHMEAASGVCSLIKVLLGMQHGKLAPCAGLKSLNSAVHPASLPFHFPLQAQDWSANARGTRVAGINSFGMGGSNAFVVLESHPPAPPPPALIGEPALVVLSARSPQALHTYLKSVCAYLGRSAAAATRFADLAYSSQVGRVAFEHRLAIIATDAGEFMEKAEQYLARSEAGGVHAGRGRIDEPLSELLTGEAGKSFVDALVQARQWDKLAAIWVRGCEVDWRRMHTEAGRRRVSFPAAPFENVTCDIRSSSVGSIPPLATPASAEAEADVPACTDIGAVPSLGGGAPPAGCAWFPSRDELAYADHALPAGGPDADHNEGARQYWLQYLPDTDTASRLAPALWSGNAAAGGHPAETHLYTVSATLNRAQVECLQRCTQLHRIEAETLIAAAWAILINRYTKARFAQFGILRAFAPVAGVVGEPAGSGVHRLRSLVPMRVCTVGPERVSRWLPALQHDMDRKHVYARAPLHQIEGWIGRENLFDSVLIFNRPRSDAADLPQIGQSFSSEAYASQPQLAMELNATIQEDSVTLDLIYKAARVQNDMMATVLEHCHVLLDGLAQNPERNPAALAMRTKSEGRDRFWKTLDRVGENR